MAASEITVQELTLEEAEVSFAAANVDGNFISNNGNIGLRLANGSGSEITATVAAQNACSQGFNHDVVITIPAGDTVEVGKLPIRYYNDALGNINITYTDVTSLTIAAVQL
jgi:hypothetical protein